MRPHLPLPSFAAVHELCHHPERVPEILHALQHVLQQDDELVAVEDVVGEDDVQEGADVRLEHGVHALEQAGGERQALGRVWKTLEEACVILSQYVVT